MKVLSGLMMVGLCSAAAVAQGQPKVVAGEARVVAEVAGAATAVKGQPFSAEAVSESVQTLADGNRIVQSSTSKFYRNSDGKIRREMTGGTGGMSFFNFSEPGVSIAEPSGNRILLNQAGRTAQTVTVVTPDVLKVREAGPLTDEQRKAVEKIRTFHTDGQPLSDEQKKAIQEMKVTTVVGGTPGMPAIAPLPPMGGGAGFGSFMYSTGDHKAWETKSEDLGTQTIEGLACEGTRRTTVIPAGSIGNERPIEIVYDRWYSKELQVVVQSKHSDPRFGEQTYTLKNIVRAEPDPSLFTVPQGWKVIAPVAPGEFVRTPKPALAPAAPKQD